MFPNDITERKHKGNPASVDANKRAEPSKAVTRQLIYNWAKERKDFTLKEVCAALGKFPHQVSGRLSEMRMEGVIKPTGERREGCSVLQTVN